jgi:hypothetical protein
LCLRLWAGDVGVNQKKCSIHDSSSVQHSCHKNVVTGAIDEWHVSHEFELSRASNTLTLEHIFFATSSRSITVRSGAWWVITFVDLRIGIPQLDCNVPLQFILETNSLDARDGFHNSRLTMCYMTNCTDVDGSLPTDKKYQTTYSHWY